MFFSPKSEGEAVQENRLLNDSLGKVHGEANSEKEEKEQKTAFRP